MADTAQTRPLLLGHRGCRGAFPENTFAAFDHALASGCDGFEFDVRLTGDSKTVICHDSVLSGSRVESASYAALQNKHLNLFRRLLGRQAREVCCLEEVIKRYTSRAFLEIELKVAGLEALTISALKGVDPARYVVSSFLPEVLQDLHNAEPEIPLGFIFDREPGLRSWRDMPANYLMPQQKLLSRERIAEMHHAGKRVIAWTVNDPRLMRRFADWSVDGVVSDDPVLLSNTLGGHRSVAP